VHLPAEPRPQMADRFAGLFEVAVKGSLGIALCTVRLAEVLSGPHKAGHTALAKHFEKALYWCGVEQVPVSIATLTARLRA